MSDRRTEPRPDQENSDRRRERWSEFRHAYPGVLATMAFTLLVLVAANGFLLYKRGAYQAETTRLRASMTDFERERADLALASDERRFQVMVELIRRQADVDERLHLAVNVDSGRMYLARDGAVLRDFPTELAPERTVGVAPDTVRLAIPRGVRTVERIITENDAWEVPAWVYEQRGQQAPADRVIPGALGPVGLVLNGGTVIYTQPPQGPLADSAYVLPGSVRVARSHLVAIAPNLRPGMAVYFY